MNRLEYTIQSKVEKKHPIAVVLHLFYTELFDEIRTNLDFLGNNFDLYVSVPEEKANFIETIKSYYPDARILKVENRGRDLAPFLEFLKIILPLEYEFLLKIHTKETIHRPDGISWRKDVFSKLLGSENQIKIIKKIFSKNPSLAMIGPKDHVLDSRYYMGSNRDKVQSLLYKAGYPQSIPESFSFVASTMFWAKPDIFIPLLKMEIETDNFEPEPLSADGCLPHALERFLGLLVEIQDYEIKSIDEDGTVSTPDPYKIYPFATPPAHLRLRELKSIVFYSAYDEAYAIEHLRITAPFTAAGIEIIDGVRNGIADPSLATYGDAVIFQREFPKNVILYEQIVSNARNAGKFVFYEIDDLLFELPENHPERKQELYNNALLPMITAMVGADLVLVPTEELRRIAEGFNPNVIVLPNYLDDSLWHLKAPNHSSDDRLLKIGYMGSNSHTPDLALVAPVLKEILKNDEGKVQVDIWGTPLPEELNGVEGVNWHPSPTNVYKDFVKFFQTLEFDIAIAPLADNLFNRCKSGLKFLEYSANGTPGVYSRVAPYEAIVEDGVNGFLAGNEEEWFISLSKLIENATLRQEMVKAAQKEIRENWLLSNNIRSWEDIFIKLTKDVYFEDLSKYTRSNILNHINRQLYFDRVNAETYSLKRDEEFSTRFRELEAPHQKDIEKTVGEYKEQIEQQQKEFESHSVEYEAQIEQNNERIRKLLEDNDSLKEQLYYWSTQAQSKSTEVLNLLDRVNTAERTLNEIYQSRSWKALSSFQANIDKITKVSKKVFDIDAPIERLLPGRLAKKKQTIIDSGLFDPDYYLSKNPDVKNAGIDPLEHFLNFGGVEGRNPSPKFDSSWYLEKYPDVKAAGINPLLHFLLYGKEEGRVSQAVTSQENVPTPLIPSAPTIKKVTKTIPDVIVLTQKIKEIFEHQLKDNYVLSLSHDDYLTITGGAQVYITDEQRLVNQQNQSYIHIYPFTKGKALVSSDTILYLGVNLDGKRLLETESNELVSALADIKDKKLTKLSIHHSMGFSSSTLQALLDLAGRKGIFWLHDYFSLCPSYNLRRNDQEYCGAPDIDSNACRLCSYGDQRRVQALEFEHLFRENQLEIAAPSRFCYEFWQSRFPVISPARIIPPAVLRWGRNNPGRYKGGQLRIGFLGYPLDYKGWGTWLRLVNEFKGKNTYRFFHFSSQQGDPGNYNRIDTRVTKENRLAMVENLRWNQIDVAFLWSTVAETFSFTLHEALAAGCFIVTNPNSGNIQDYIRRNPERGIVLDGEDELIDYLHGDGLVHKVIDYQKQGKPQAELIFGNLEEIN
jgi:glycosyltransferase involved in cell wall biosynthesis